jgi:FkbM family methyltransferase
MNLKKIIKENIIFKIKDLNERLSPAGQQELQKRKDFYQNFVSPGDLCFDVGANMGNRIAPLLNIGARVLAVEPQQPCYDFLKSKFGNKIILVTKGLCEEECVRQFHISNASTISSFSDEWINSVKNDRFKEYNWDKTIDVEMTTLDNLIKQHGVPAFIKIDVEGYELEVLKGLSRPIKMISFEYTVPEQTQKVIDCITTIEKNSPDILCNFSIGESMEWAMTNWMTVPEFFEYIQTKEFLDTGFGDIYVKQK